MKALLTLASLVGIARAVSSSDVVIEEWEAWKMAFGQNYSTLAEEKFRMNVFMGNKAKIAKHNYQAHRGQHSYFLKMNRFGDLLHHEFVSQMNGYRDDLREQSPKGATFISPANVDLPTEVDWRTRGGVTPVKDQGNCGSCWAFSATGSLEGQHFRKNGKIVSLSEQNLMDCSLYYGNYGCNGGLMDYAFKYIKENGGIDTEEAYPYEGALNDCRYQVKTKGASDIGFVDLPKGDEQKLKEAVATMGPVSVAIDASHEAFMFYSHGIYDEPHCQPDSLDHGVLVIGYGSEDGADYWLVKNSWGTKWGDAGFIKMTRNKQNQCGIASKASFPLV
uniref:Cathepsin L3 n=1 Tax=Tigriopus japonicus TaxID=158387 RepID=A0A0H4KC34_TIGJA|nr:cathepsin L3 [Tigriopus japonicus]